MNYKEEKITIGDIADALGISKTTVSRAISGKGRIGSETVQRVQEYIKEHDYRPNPLAKGLANARTYNLAWVMPGDSEVTDLPFFQKCMIGISEVASERDYDVIMSLVYDDDMSSLVRIVKNHKVDGVILGRTLVKDERIEYLKSQGIPFVAIGSCSYDNVIQVDNDHLKACSEFTGALVLKGLKNLSLIGGMSTHMVNQSRKRGFEEGLETNKLAVEKKNIYMDCISDSAINRAVEDVLKKNIDCIVCMDDRICSQVLEHLRNLRIEMPADIKVASMYNSVLLDNVVPAITAINYDPKELGYEACKVILNKISGEEVALKTLMGYNILMRGSTN